MKGFLLVFAALAASAAAQDLTTFAGVKEALLNGDELQLNADANRCDSVNLQNEDMFISFPLRHWQHVTLRTGAEEIRADDFYVDTFSPEVATFFTRAANIYDDGSVVFKLNIFEADNTTATTITITCALGVGAEMHKLINANDVIAIDNYQTLKSYLLLGDHVEAIGYLNQCSNSDDIFTNGNQYVVGYQINRFTIFGDAGPLEALVIDDVALYSADGESFVVGAEQVIARPDGSALLTIAVYDLSLEDTLVYFVLECQLGVALRFTVHERENEATYANYASIKEATLSGHDMEVVAFLGSCTVLEGPTDNFAGDIVSARADQFQLFKAGELWGEREYISFGSWSIGVNRNLYVDIARVYEDGTMIIEYHIENPSIPGAASTGTLDCPLRRATVFHAVPRTRTPLTDYEAILNEIVRVGQTFEIEIDYDQCETASGAPLNSVFGGIAWQTYIDLDPENGYFYADIYALVEQRLVEPSPSPAWNAAGIIVLPDGTVIVQARLYQLGTGLNIAPTTEDITCRLGSGVTFFPYPTYQ